MKGGFALQRKGLSYRLLEEQSIPQNLCLEFYGIFMLC